MGARPTGLAAVLSISLSLLPGVALAADASATITVVACKALDEAGGSNQLVFELRDDRIHAFRYRRSTGAPRCEIEASRSPSGHPWERSDWIDNDDTADVRLYSDDVENAHVRIARSGVRIELRVIDYDRWWHCGTGQMLHPVIAAQRGEDMCILGAGSGADR